MAAAAVF